GGEERTLNHLELEMWMVESCHGQDDPTMRTKWTFLPPSLRLSFLSRLCAQRWRDWTIGSSLLRH
ncbi:hypothetical protein STEG23_027099, partial [Scotinomys teguina]